MGTYNFIGALHYSCSAMVCFEICSSPSCRRQDEVEKSAISPQGFQIDIHKLFSFVPLPLPEFSWHLAIFVRVSMLMFDNFNFPEVFRRRTVIGCDYP
jgi:hypothetical protein